MSKKKDILTLIIRLIIGGIFITTGWMKISDIPMTIGFFHVLGLPDFLAYVVGYVEFIGGILVVLGLFINEAAVFLTAVMLCAIYFSLSGGFQMYSLPLATLAAVLSLFNSGAGAYAVKFKKKS